MNAPPTNSNYRCIGKGFCGSIWALDDHPDNDDRQTVIKCEDGGPGRSVKNDYDMHRRFLLSARLNPPSLPLSIPQCHELILANDPWWNSRLPQFPHNYSACRAFVSKRIPRVPRTISNKLVDLSAGIDANDVEFVLAPPRKDHPPELTFQSDFPGTHCMWIIDFDCCHPMTMDDAGIKQACEAFYRNDPYYPRPGSGYAENEELWNVFKGKFLACSWNVKGHEHWSRVFLAQKLMDEIEKEGEARRIRSEAESHVLDELAGP